LALLSLTLTALGATERVFNYVGFSPPNADLTILALAEAAAAAAEELFCAEGEMHEDDK
jgi:hypothetical protein